MKKSLKYKRKTHKKNSKKLQKFKKTLKYKKNTKRFSKKTRKNKYKKYFGGMRVRNISTNEVRDEEDDYTLQDGEEEVDQCPICYEDDTPENPLLTLHNPGGNAPPHKFHAGCIGDMLESQQLSRRGPVTCPYCNTFTRDGPLIEQLRALNPLVANPPAANPVYHPIVGNMDNRNLVMACGRGNLDEALKLIAQGADVNAEVQIAPVIRVRPLMKAAENNRVECVAMLLDRGANINARDTIGQTALHYASRGGATAAAAMLVDRGADINAKCEEGDTPLMASCEFYHARNLNCTAMLLDRGAIINDTNSEGMTALMFASRGRNVPCMELLVARGADVNVRANDGRTALSLSDGSQRHGYDSDEDEDEDANPNNPASIFLREHGAT